MSLKALFLVVVSLGGLGVSSSPTPRDTNNTTSSPYRAPAKGPTTDFTQALNGQGAPGIYTSSQTPDNQYGTYNWCNMPHVRKSEYKKPSKEYQLQYVEIIQRHHKRTPYASNTFFKEDISWNCTDEGPYAYGKSNTGLNVTPVYWQAQRGSANPFEKTVGPGFVGSNCVFPAITSGGLDDALQHGKDIRHVYGDMLGFLPSSDEKDKYAFRVTNNVITSQTMGATVKGLYPNLKEHSAWIQPSSYDSLEPAFSCPAGSALNKQYEANNATWLDHLTRSGDLRARFNNISGIQPMDTAGWNTSWDHPYDNLSAKQCHGKSLPCSVNATSLCLSQDDANTIYRIGQWEYAWRWRGSPQALQYSALKMGPWVTELLGHLNAVKSGQSCMKYMHNFAHDGSIAPLFGIFQLDTPVWPGMGSEIVFELWQKDGQWFVRVLFKGQPFVSSSELGTLDMVPFDKFQAYLASVIPSDPVAACKAS